MNIVLIWIAIVSFAAMLGALISLISTAWVRRSGVTLACVIPLLMLLGVAFRDGCMPAITPWLWMQASCQSWGMLLALSVAIVPLWALIVLLGAWLGRRMLRAR
ncbi:hypothetical protein SH584_02815 [Sphingomonas sp. LY29]|uniref:hypothetical protein n=1 Tax=Sphingomonas sp. LY29 TaxID=3095341 RepID=UPI002D76F1A7|nr:hypothetical protein [Sphingomonas sp. LY29]WRP26389.1 hypothetical protein SH584_02815 [Sphingomonas sp. LY29]